MSIITIQGFDSHDWSTMAFQGWTEAGTVAHLDTGGRRDKGAISLPSSDTQARYTLPAAKNYLVAGFAAYFGEASFSEETFFVMRDDAGGMTQLALQVNENGSLSVLRNATVIDTSAANVVPAQRWCYLEMEATIHNTAGRYQVRVNEVTVLNRVNVDTQASGNATVDQIRFQYMGGATDKIDDFYLLDSGDTINNTLLGDRIVDTLTVDGNGAINEWTPLSGDNYEMVDETLMDDDTTYVSSGNTGDIDLYTINPLTDLGVTGTINAVVVCNAVRHDGGSQDVRCILRIGGINYSVANYTTISQYEYAEALYERNPATLVAWTEAQVNALEIGIWMVP